MTDNAANTATTFNQAYIIDAIVPTISALSPAAGTYNAAQSVTFTVTDTGGAGLEPADVSITGGTGGSCSVVTASQVSCSVAVNSSDSISITATDNA